jgi:hypothetical protein
MSTEGFYDLVIDPALESCWFLKAPRDSAGNEIDPRIFTEGDPVDLQLPSTNSGAGRLRTRNYFEPVDAPLPLSIPVRWLGPPLDFNFAAFDMIVTPRTLNEELEALVGPAIQRIPVTVEGQGDKFEILNVCECVKCIDDSRSDVERWTAEHGRPEKIGQYLMFVDLKIDPAIARGHHIFRLAGWEIALIASEKVKRLFEARKVTGLGYRRVDI